jgi:amidase
MDDGFDDLDRLDATGFAEALRSAEISIGDVQARTLRRIGDLDPQIGAIAELADGPQPFDRTGPLAGVPFVVKDLGMDVAGMHGRNGSKLFADKVSTADSELVRRYRKAGLWIVATTKVPELGRNASTEPLLQGPTHNPHRLTHSPGGSSGGTAAAIAAGMVPIGHGNDGGGSIRIPASMCGLFGLKPTRGRTTAFPRRTTSSYPLGINHVLTRSVRDSALLLDLTAGPMPGDPYQTPPPARPYVDEVGADPGRLRIALATGRPDGGAVHADCVAATEQAAKLLESLGHDVEVAAPEWPADALRFAMTVFMSAPMAGDIDARLAELGRELADDDLEPMTRMVYENGKRLTATDVVAAHQELERVAQLLGAFHQTYDLVLTPTMAQPVPPLGTLDTTRIESMVEHGPAYSSFTGVANVTGQPAVSLPLATDSTGLPIGIQLMAAYGREDLLVRVSSQVEAAQPWSILPVRTA